MSTTRFETTISAIKEGAKNFATDKAVKNIEGWEEYLSKHDHQGVKGVVSDLGKLKQLLQSEKLDGTAIKNLVHKLGKETTAVAGDETSGSSAKIKELGEALSKAS